MSVGRLSVTVSAELGASLRALAAERQETVSAIVAEAIAHRVRMAALEAALDEADSRFGPVPGSLVDDAEAELRGSKGRATRQVADLTKDGDVLLTSDVSDLRALLSAARVKATLIPV